MALTIHAARTAVFRDEAAALDPLVALCGALASVTPLGSLWARFCGARVQLDREVLALLLREDRSIRADLPEYPTHVIRPTATSSGPGELGVITVTVRADVPDGAPAGLELDADLPVELDATALLRLLERCIEATSADVAVIGPRSWVEDHGVGWATFARRIRRELLPANARVIPTKGGSLIIAHAEEPASESRSAREAVLRVRDALSPDAPKAVAPAPEVAPAREVHSPAATAQPSYLAAAPPATTPRRRPLAETALGPITSPEPALPFAPGPAPAAAPSVRRVRPPAELTGTADGVELPQGPALPFVPCEARHAAPELTLEQYADLRARLSVRGEEDAETWTAFGVTSRTVKEALQAGFAARFREDPGTQARFVELVQARSAALRAS
jgi:hypothetical protein